MINQNTAPCWQICCTMFFLFQMPFWLRWRVHHRHLWHETFGRKVLRKFNSKWHCVYSSKSGNCVQVGLHRRKTNGFPRAIRIHPRKWVHLVHTVVPFGSALPLLNWLEIRLQSVAETKTPQWQETRNKQDMNFWKEWVPLSSHFFYFWDVNNYRMAALPSVWPVLRNRLPDGSGRRNNDSRLSQSISAQHWMHLDDSSRGGHVHFA